MKKLSSITKNTGRCTELKFEWLGWQEKLASEEPKLAFVIMIRGITGVNPKDQRCCSFFISIRSSKAPL